MSIIKEEPIQITTSGAGMGGADSVAAPFSSSSSASSSTSAIGKFEDEKAYRAWKKSIMMALTNIACHK